MRRLLLSLAGIACAFLLHAQTVKKIEVTEGRLQGISKALRDMPHMQAPPPTNFRKLMSEKNDEHETIIKVYSSGEIPGGDPVLQRRKPGARENGMN
ncbi:MAG TPA: hypothetical protein VD996_14695, partial [Chitinophagaceae bacterium]|nr:hypothetical protein [Chitinophagaceae bacterium]